MTVDVILPLLREVDVAVGLEDELVKLLDVRVLALHGVDVGEGEGWLLVPVDDVHRGHSGGLDREERSGDHSWDWDCGDGEEVLVRPSRVTNLLGDGLADPHGHSLVLQPG